MIRFSDAQSIPGLKRLWKECFADEDAYINAFFDALYDDKNVLLKEENGVLIGASFFLNGDIYLEPAHFKTDGEWRKIRYVYALAVFPQFRGRGTAGELLHRAHETYHAPLIAEPAEEGLVGGFYKPLGFKEAFYLEKKRIEVPQYDVRAAELPETVDFSSVEAEEYCRIRDAHFQKHGYVRWPAEHAAFAIREHCSSGGGAYAVRRNGREDVFLYYKEGQDIIVTETTLAETEVMDMVLPWASGRCSGLVLTGAAKQAGKNCCLTGMSYGMPAVLGYLNLSLD